MGPPRRQQEGAHRGTVTAAGRQLGFLSAQDVGFLGEDNPAPERGHYTPFHPSLPKGNTLDKENEGENSGNKILNAEKQVDNG